MILVSPMARASGPEARARPARAAGPSLPHGGGGGARRAARPSGSTRRLNPARRRPAAPAPLFSGRSRVPAPPAAAAAAASAPHSPGWAGGRYSSGGRGPPGPGLRPGPLPSPGPARPRPGAPRPRPPHGGAGLAADGWASTRLRGRPAPWPGRGARSRVLRDGRGDSPGGRRSRTRDALTLDPSGMGGSSAVRGEWNAGIALVPRNGLRKEGGSDSGSLEGSDRNMALQGFLSSTTAVAESTKLISSRAGQHPVRIPPYSLSVQLQGSGSRNGLNEE
ncbi:uncharacterized protein LOC141585404 [Saimiri boliviensis]|uniref:uncharacterized protein LOC141585404 n=1 Tax=Saimiri boliviensis TaxID=27679 RepID=UPI003D7752B0